MASESSESSESLSKTLPCWYPAVIVAIFGVLFGAIWFNANHLPSGLSSYDEVYFSLIF